MGSNNKLVYRLSKEEQIQLWHRKIGHASLSIISNALRNEAIMGLLDLDVNNQSFCGDCQIGKQTRSPHKSVRMLYK